jgi:hypothetical protein
MRLREVQQGTLSRVGSFTHQGEDGGASARWSEGAPSNTALNTVLLTDKGREAESIDCHSVRKAAKAQWPHSAATLEAHPALDVRGCVLLTHASLGGAVVLGPSASFFAVAQSAAASASWGAARCGRDVILAEDEAAPAHARQLALVLRAIVFQHEVGPLRHSWGGLRPGKKTEAKAVKALQRSKAASPSMHR